jgi:hypothetical protein
MPSPPPAPSPDVVGALALKFVLELCALAALAFWGATTGPVLVRVALGIGAPLIAALAWGRWAAPRSPRRLAGARRLALELTVFTAAAAALGAAGAPALGALLLVLALVDAWLLHRWGL